MKENQLSTLLAVLLTTATSSTAALVSVSSNAVTGGNAGTVNSQIIPTALEGPLGGLGTTWNILGGYSGSGLLDSAGNGTSIGFSTNYTERRGVTGTIGLEAARTFYQDFGRGNARNVGFSGLTPGQWYNVSLISVSNSSGGTEASVGTFSTTNFTFSPNSQTIDGRNSNGGRNVSTFVQGQNTVFFKNIIADSSGEINFIADAADAGEFDANAYRLQLNGAQILRIPEPSSFGLLGLSVIGFTLRRRR
ncbi:MAG: PEP-CTERM sorting domain-containing protein [Akkermansiaceae bacterium]